MSSGIGILGTGLAAEIHSKTLKAVLPTLRRWYASRDENRAAAASLRFGGAGAFGSYEAALTSREIDVVLIGLPPSLHKEWTLRALDAGKHVIVEKPPFLSTAELDEVDAAARRAGRQVMVAENYFYKPLTAVLKRAITSGDLGDVLFVQVTALKGQATSNWRDDVRLAGGGALFEGGIHWVSLLANIGLTPGRVMAASPRSSELHGTLSGERSAIVTIEYAEGAVATLAYSWDVPSLINGVRMSRIYGTRGTLRFETNGIFALQTGRRVRPMLPGVTDLAGYRAMMKDFVAAIDEGRPPLYSLTLARRDLRLIEDAYASITGSHST